MSERAAAAGSGGRGANREQAQLAAEARGARSECQVREQDAATVYEYTGTQCAGIGRE